MKNAFFLCSILLVACGGEAPPPESPQPNAPAPASIRGKLVGRWGPTLPPSQAHDVTTARAALSDPPDDAAFEAMNPTADDRDKYKALLQLKTTDPTNPRLDAVKQSLHAYESMLIEITPESFQWRTPTRSEKYRYSVISENADTVTIAVDGDSMDVKFIDDDHVAMKDSKKTMLMTRDRPLVKGAAADAKSPPAAYNGPKVRGGRDEDAPPASSPSDDACTRYANCIDQMPRLKGDQSVMQMSSSTIRGWERTPDRLKQCKQALELARAGALCR